MYRHVKVCPSQKSCVVKRRRREATLVSYSDNTSTATMAGRRASSWDVCEDNCAFESSAIAEFAQWKNLRCEESSVPQARRASEKGEKKDQELKITVVETGLPAQRFFASFIPMRYSPKRETERKDTFHLHVPCFHFRVQRDSS